MFGFTPPCRMMPLVEKKNAVEDKKACVRKPEEPRSFYGCACKECVLFQIFVSVCIMSSTFEKAGDNMQKMLGV